MNLFCYKPRLVRDELENRKAIASKSKTKKRLNPNKRSSNQKYLTYRKRRCLGIKLIFYYTALKFTPTPKRNIIQLKSDIHNYIRKLGLTEFFHNAPENNNLQNIFKTKSHFTPSRNRDRDLDHQIDILNNLDLEIMDISSKNNLSKTEQ